MRPVAPCISVLSLPAPADARDLPRTDARTGRSSPAQSRSFPAAGSRGSRRAGLPADWLNKRKARDDWSGRVPLRAHAGAAPPSAATVWWADAIGADVSARPSPSRPAGGRDVTTRRAARGASPTRLCFGQFKMAVQESAAQLSMTLKVQEYPTLKVGSAVRTSDRAWLVPADRGGSEGRVEGQGGGRGAAWGTGRGRGGFCGAELPGSGGLCAAGSWVPWGLGVGRPARPARPARSALPRVQGSTAPGFPRSGGV